MLSLLKKFPKQIDEAIKIGQKIDMEAKVENVIISGMGGSGIVGDILKHLARIPIFVSKNYYIPSFASQKTLFIAISYSGNTEETIKSYEIAKKKKCKTLIITSGGILGEEENAVLIPSGMQPRAAIAYLLFPPAVFLEKIGAIEKLDYDGISSSASAAARRHRVAKELAAGIDGIPIIYGDGILGTIAKRWRQQFNENAKMAAFDFSMPECNHNEIEAWENGPNKFTCIFLRSRMENERIKIRYEFMKEIYVKKAKVMEVFGEGSNKFSEAIYLLHLGDVISVYKAIEKGVDPEPVNLISELKKKLSTQDPHH